MRTVIIEQLAAAIDAIHRWPVAGDSNQESVHVPTGWPPIDHALGGGLRRGGLHEWLGLGMPGDASIAATKARRHEGTKARSEREDSPPLTSCLCASVPPCLSLPPLSLLIHLAWRAIESPHVHPAALVIWVGKRCWPHPRTMTRSDDQRLLDRSLFIDPPDDASRLWTIDVALRSPATCAVIADGTDFDMAATRRLQLAAGVGSTLSLLARPLRDLRRLSSAATRWIICPQAPSSPRRVACGDPKLATASRLRRPQACPRWTVELLRCKGVRPVLPADTTRWALELNHATGALDCSAQLVHRLAETA